MPYNKGDFTQQGVAGHVNANLRLNEKRLVNIDLTSNEEAEGCAITGTVKDLLNDKVYGIGSGVSGNIEITENGENINVAPYATATVNVSGGGNVWYGELTITNNGEPRQIELTTYNDSGIVPFLRLIKPTITNSDTLKVSIAPGDSKLVSTLITIYKLEGELAIPLSASSGTTIVPYAIKFDDDENIVAFVYKITSTGDSATITINRD